MTTTTEKQARMTLRRATGSREPSRARPKASGPAYLFPYACFACRKCFKRKADEGLPDKSCPNCKGVAVGLSRDFKAPPVNDIQEWRKVAFLVERGFRFFHQYNAEGHLVPYPATMAEAVQFVALLSPDALYLPKEGS